MGGASFPIYGRLVFRRGNRNRDSTWKTGLYFKAEKNISTSSAASLQITSLPARMSWVPGCKNYPGHPGNSLLPGCPGRSLTNMEEKRRNSQQHLFSFVRGLLPWAFSRCQGTWEADTWEHTSSWSQVPKITFILFSIDETNNQVRKLLLNIDLQE